MRMLKWLLLCGAALFLSLNLLQIRTVVAGGFKGDFESSGGDEDNGLNYTVPTNGLWLEITGVSNELACLNLHNATNLVYEIWSTTNLSGVSWNIEQELWPTDNNSMPFTIPLSDRPDALFIWARDWTGVTSGGNETPEWWFWKYFGMVDLSDTNRDSQGNTFLRDYQNGIDPDHSNGMTVMMAVGGERILELTDTGDVISWGGNQYGELGDYTYLDSDAPLVGNNVAVQVVGLTNIIKIASGLNHSLAIDSNGTLWAWGQNNQGQLGDGGCEYDANFPVPVPGMTNTIAIATHGYIAGSDGEYGISLAVEADGTVWEWGGADAYGFGGYSPVQMPDLSNVVSVAAGSVYALALKDDGMVWAWGEGYSDTPRQVGGLSNIVAVCADGAYNLAMDSNGVVWAWGKVPAKVEGLVDIIAVAAGANHFLALDGGGQLWAWGWDGDGQLGDGGLIGRTNFPIKVSGMTNIISIAAGSDASVALDGDGHLWQWGKSDNDVCWRDGAFFDLWAWGDESGLPALAPQYADFYKGQLPILTILSGNNQVSHAGLEFRLPLAFRVTDADGAALSNAPVSVEVVAGNMELRAISGGDNHKGLRLTTDANGEAFLVGYADQSFYNADCVVKVLATSRGRIVEVDFNETLIPPPTISIISPADCGTYLVGTNRALTITVDAEAASGASIQEVDYYFGTNGVADTLLGISTQTPYSFIWNDSKWWTDSFVGQYTLSAIAVDDAGAQSDSQGVNITIALDSDGNGVPDYWQLQFFGHLGVDPCADPDGDDTSNLQEYENGTDPTDYYNGNTPTLEIFGGNDQAGNYDSFLPLPVTIRVVGTYSVVLPHAPVTFTVTNGTALLAVTTNDVPVKSLDLRTDTNGQVSAWVYFPEAGFNPPDSAIVVSASGGAGSTAVIVNEFVPLGHWTFNDTNMWVGEEGQLPLLATNVMGVPSWSSNAVLVDSISPAQLVYNVVETNGDTNFNCQTGSVMFWFKPNWSSKNAGGDGPGSCGRLIEIGDYNSAFTKGWWALHLNPDGTQLLFGTSANGDGMTNLAANISWYSNEWHQIGLTYSPTSTALFVDGQLVMNGLGVTCFPNADEQANGFRIGSDQDGNNRAGGAFDELETFNYPLDAANTYAHGSDIPDWWEVKYFNRTGLNPDFKPAGSGYTLLLDYQYGTDPNVINFSLLTTNRYVNNNTVPIQVNVLGGIPSFMTVEINTNPFVVVPDLPFNINSNFVAATWQPYNSSIVVPLDSGDADYYVWVGLRGLPHDAQPAWRGIKLTLDTTPPLIAITGPASNTVSQPMIQLQGCANESLSSLTFDISNAAGIWTNQTGYVTDQFYDTNLLKFTTNYFQCYDIILTTNGANTITLRVTDMAGNQTTTNLNLALDYTADTTLPVLTIIWPQDGTSISGGRFTFEGQVDDPTAHITASITDANGNTNVIQGLVERNGLVWAQDLPLNPGTNIVTVTATDAAGNASVTNFNVIENDVGLTITPLEGGQLNQACVTVTGTIGNPMDDCVVVNGVKASVDEDDGSWTAYDVPVNSAGTASLYVQVYVGDPVLVAEQTLFQLQPIQVGVMSYGSSGFYHWMSPHLMPVDPDPPAHVGSTGWLIYGPAYENVAGALGWTYLSGGFQQGYFVFTGFITDYYDSPAYGVYAYAIPAGINALSIPGYSVTWENVSLSFSAEFNEAGIFNGTCVDQESDTQSRVMIEAQGQVAAGTTKTYLVQAQATGVDDLGNPTNQLPPGSLQIQGVTLTPVTNAAGLVLGQTLISAPAGVNVDVTPMTNINYAYNVHAWEINFQLAVDANRDGNITFDAQDLTTPSWPYRFWVNDDYDGFGGEVGVQDDLDPSTGKDATNAVISCTRDLEDYTRLWMKVLNLTNELQNGTLLLALQWEDASNNPAIRIFPAVETNGGTLYLTDIATAQAQTNAPFGTNIVGTNILNHTWQFTVTTNAPFFFTTNFWSNFETNPVTYLLFDGVSSGSGKLVLALYKSDGTNELAEGQPLYLDLKDIKQMYERWSAGEGNGDPPLTAATNSSARSPSGTGPFQYDSSSPEASQYILFVHGWNMHPWEKDAWAETAYKRLYWQGYKGRFGAFQWPTTYHDFDFESSFDFDVSEFAAWNSAVALEGLLNSLHGQYGDSVYVLAHSHGNVVVGEALRLAAQDGLGKIVNTYVASQAAIAVHCYDPDQPLPGGFFNSWRTVGGIPLYPTGPGTPNIYPNWLATNGAVVLANFYNINDYALSRSLWETDQAFKPDSTGPNAPYGYADDPEAAPVEDGFTKYGQVGFDHHPIYGNIPLHLGNTFNVRDRYEITAFAAEPRCRALGATSDAAGFGSQNLQALWPPDSFETDVNKLYSDHPWHSAEFRFDNMMQRNYWHSLLNQFRLLTQSQNP